MIQPYINHIVISARYDLVIDQANRKWRHTEEPEITGTLTCLPTFLVTVRMQYISLCVTGSTYIYGLIEVLLDKLCYDIMAVGSMCDHHNYWALCRWVNDLDNFFYHTRSPRVNLWKSGIQIWKFLMFHWSLTRLGKWLWTISIFSRFIIPCKSVNQ